MKILLVHTGGTIGSGATDEARVQNSETVGRAKRYLIEAFKRSGSPYANAEIIDASFPTYETTLSESMTPKKLSEIVSFIRESLEIEDYSGIVVLHGTDTLAYTASIFAFLFAGLQIPMFLVSGNRPPEDDASNARDNFRAAIELICRGIAPNVYVTYRNSDNIVRLYLASCILQSANFSEDFLSASKDRVFTLDNIEGVMQKCGEISHDRRTCSGTELDSFEALSERALFIRPYTGLDYRLFSHCLGGEGYLGIVHGSYHSGTVSFPGLVLREEARKCREAGDILSANEFERRAEVEAHSSRSIWYLSELCRKNGAKLFVAPSALGTDQYETMNVVANETSAILLNMTAEAAYAKLTVALSYGMSGDELVSYMSAPITGEFIC